MIDKSAIDQIRERLDIVEVVREYVPTLKKAGRGFKACCPFHQERTPSFNVSQDKQLWYCFGSCHDGGDVFKFVMRAESLSFTEAAQRLAERVGVQWQANPETLGPRERERLQLKEALEFAKDFYRGVLERSPEADGARRYLTQRGVSPESRQRFELGFALTDGHSFMDAALKKGFAPQLLLKAGILAEREGGRLRDYFRSRVLFPIRDARGAVVGFGGRAFGDFEPKYLNTPESPVFSKGRTLYGLYQGGPSIRKQGKAVLVEGYMDVVACHQHGLTNAVAPLGTAVTPDHAQSLRRYCDEALMLFDADAAGLNAAIRGAELLLEGGLSVRVGSVPDGKDPDEFLKAHGPQALTSHLEGAADPAEFKTELLLRQQPPKNIEDKVKLAGLVLETVLKQPNDVVKHEWMRRLSQRLGLDEQAIKNEAKKLKQAGPKFPVRAAKPKPAEPEWKGVDVEEEIIRLVLQNPQLLAKVSHLGPNDFPSERLQRIWSVVLAHAGQADFSHAVLAAVADEDRGWLTGLMLQERRHASPETELEKHAKELFTAKVAEGRFRELQAKIAGGSTDPEVLREFMELTRQTRGTAKS